MACSLLLLAIVEALLVVFVSGQGPDVDYCEDDSLAQELDDLLLGQTLEAMEAAGEGRPGAALLPDEARVANLCKDMTDVTDRAKNQSATCLDEYGLPVHNTSQAQDVAEIIQILTDNKSHKKICLDGDYRFDLSHASVCIKTVPDAGKCWTIYADRKNMMDDYAQDHPRHNMLHATCCAYVYLYECVYESMKDVCTEREAEAGKQFVMLTEGGALWQCDGLEHHCPKYGSDWSMSGSGGMMSQLLPWTFFFWTLLVMLGQ